jgi:uncharacterized protein YxeA
MKKIMIAALGLSLLPVTALFAQNTSTSSMGTDTNTMKSTKKSKKKKSTKGSSDTMSSTTSTATQSK